MSKFWTNYPNIMDELTDVKEVIKKNIKSREKYLEESIYPMIDAGGKMLRPAFLMIAGKFGDYEPDKMHNLGAVIELLHLATLVHDDIMDDSKLRRGVETVQSKYGKEYAVYIGDFLLCQCFMMLSDYEYDQENLKNISKAISKVCMGEITQYHLRYSTNMDLRNYIRIISGKTAALFALSFFVGAREAKCDEKIQKQLGRIGYNVGMAFQIIDDLLDYAGDTQRLGKNALKDLKRGYYTLPLIFAIENDRDNNIKHYLDKEEISDRDRDEIIRLVKEYGGIDRAIQVADRYSRKAMGFIDKLPECESKTILKQVIPNLLNRKY